MKIRWMSTEVSVWNLKFDLFYRWIGSIETVFKFLDDLIKNCCRIKEKMLQLIFYNLT